MILTLTKVEKTKKEVEVNLPICFEVQTWTYSKKICLVTGKESENSVSYQGYSLNFRREDEKSDWKFDAISIGVYESDLENFLSKDKGYREIPFEQFKFGMRLVAQGMEGVVDNLDKIFKKSINNKNSKNGKK